MDLVHHQRNQCVSRLSCTKSPPVPRQFSRGDLVHRQRNQCLSRLSCTKPWSLLGQFSRGTWCIANAINAFPDFLAPSLGRFRGNSPGGLGALPTQSMRFQAFLHQVLVASGAIPPRDLVHYRRNQCVSRLSCTKSWSLLGQFPRGTWCITDAINAFPGFLAPNLSLFRANSSGGLGISPTQSMRFQAFLHQAPAGSEVKSKKLHPESKLDDKFGFRMQFSYFYTPKCTYLLYHLHLLKIFVIRAYTNVTSKLTTLDKISVIINFAKETSIKLINNIPNITVQQIIKQSIYFFILLPICSIVFTLQQVQAHKRMQQLLPQAWDNYNF